jgi:hypothetical protein
MEVMAVVLGAAIAGFAFAAVVTAGAVKMQNLESYSWSKISCILAVIPFNPWVCAPLFGIGTFDLSDFPPIPYLAFLPYLLCFPTGLACLNILKRQEVRAAFEYRSD